MFLAQAECHRFILDNQISLAVDVKIMEIVKRMLKGNEPIEKIADYTGLSIENVKNISEPPVIDMDEIKPGMNMPIGYYIGTHQSQVEYILDVGEANGKDRRRLEGTIEGIEIGMLKGAKRTL